MEVRQRSVKALSIWMVIWIAFPTLAGLFQGRTAAEKVLTGMAMPLFLVWSLLIAGMLSAFCHGRKWQGTFLLLLVVGLWIASAPVTIDRFVSRIESSVVTWNYETDQPLDSIVVFGGGTGRDATGRSQLSLAGDRAAWGARLYHLGKTKKLIATGDAAPGANAQQRDPSIQAREIWVQLQVPNDAIEEIEGINTTQEIESLKRHPDVIAGKRVGLLTSALHLPRVMRLARAAGIEAIPIASDFRSNKSRVTWLDLVPQADSLNKFDLLWKETLGGLIGR